MLDGSLQADRVHGAGGRALGGTRAQVDGVVRADDAAAGPLCVRRVQRVDEVDGGRGGRKAAAGAGGGDRAALERVHAGFQLLHVVR